MIDWFVDWWLRKCPHDDSHINADILEGGYDVAVKYCGRCGAVRPQYSSDWRRPRPLWFRLKSRSLNQIRLALAAAMFLALIPEAAAQTTRSCQRATPFQHLTATGPVEIVPGKPDARTYSCGFVLAQRGQSLDFQYWSAKAGTACAEEITALTPVFSLPADFVMVNRLENVGPASPPGHSLCIQTFGQGGMTGIIYWEQF